MGHKLTQRSEKKIIPHKICITIERKVCEPTREGECWRVITNKKLHDPIK